MESQKENEEPSTDVLDLRAKELERERREVEAKADADTMDAYMSG